MATTTDTTTRATGLSATPAPRRSLNVFDWVALVLVIIGGINWGLVGLADFDLVAALFGEMAMLTRIVYALVGLAGLYAIVMAVRLGRRPMTPALS
jgi:uncharacterized membrane protein YuzA (DUF378 family)